MPAGIGRIGPRTKQAAATRNMNWRLIAAALVAGGAALIASTTAFSADAYPKAIRQAVDSGVNVIRQFHAVSGLTAGVLAQHGHYSTVYSTADKKSLLAGALLGERGESISAQYEKNRFRSPISPYFSRNWRNRVTLQKVPSPARRRQSTCLWRRTVRIVTSHGLHFSHMKRPVCRRAVSPWPLLGRPACQRRSK